MASVPVDSCCLNCKKGFSSKCGAVGCLVCGGWCHIPCANISKELIKVIEQNPAIGIVCDPCKAGGRISTSSSTTEEIANLRDEIKCGFESVNSNIGNITREIAEIKNEFYGQIKLLQNDVISCKNNSNVLASKITLLENENNRILKRMNRCDIIATGIPNSENIKNTIINMIKFLKVNIDERDIQQCFFLDKKKTTFIKLNSADIKDNIMQSYFKLKNLKLSHFVDTDIDSRVFLNNNLTPMESKLSYFCRGLIRSKQIKKFRLLHTDIPKVKIEMLDGSTKLLVYNDCILLFGDK